jgi:hypothetical protein
MLMRQICVAIEALAAAVCLWWFVRRIGAATPLLLLVLWPCWPADAAVALDCSCFAIL